MNYAEVILNTVVATLTSKVIDWVLNLGLFCAVLKNA